MEIEHHENVGETQVHQMVQRMSALCSHPHFKSPLLILIRISWLPPCGSRSTVRSVNWSLAGYSNEHKAHAVDVTLPQQQGGLSSLGWTRCRRSSVLKKTTSVDQSDVLPTSRINWQWTAPCGLRGCKNRPAPFPGRMSYNQSINQSIYYQLCTVRQGNVN